MNLAEHISAHTLSDRWPWCCKCGWIAQPRPWRDDLDAAQSAHAAHVASSWHEHRTITTRDQIAALPRHAVVRDATGFTIRLWEPGVRNDGAAELPAHIIYHPEEDQ